MESFGGVVCDGKGLIEGVIEVGVFSGVVLLKGESIWWGLVWFGLCVREILFCVVVEFGDVKLCEVRRCGEDEK